MSYLGEANNNAPAPEVAPSKAEPTFLDIVIIIALALVLGTVFYFGVIAVTRTLVSVALDEIDKRYPHLKTPGETPAKLPENPPWPPVEPPR